MDKSIALYLFVSFVACITPGSGVLYTIASGFRGGMKCVLASPLGTCLGCSLMSALSATGLGALIANSPAAYNVLQVVSALVLVWFGLQSWRSGALDLSAASDSAAREGLGSGQERFTFRKIFWGAVVLQASNIMLIVFLLSLMPPFIRTEEPYLPQASRAENSRWHRAVCRRSMPWSITVLLTDGAIGLVISRIRLWCSLNQKSTDFLKRRQRATSEYENSCVLITKITRLKYLFSPFFAFT